MLTVALFYLLMGVLETYWNLMDWSPSVDFLSISLLGGLVLMLFTSWLLARVSCGTCARWMGGFACLSLLVLGLYLAFPERLGSGLFGRTSPSATWYRWGRVVLLAMPGLCWVACSRRKPVEVVEKVPSQIA